MLKKTYNFASKSYMDLLQNITIPTETNILNDSRLFIACQHLFVVSWLYISGTTLEFKHFIALVIGLLLLSTVYNGTRLKIHGRIVTLICVVLLSFQSSNDSIPQIIRLSSFFSALILSLEAGRRRL